MKSWKILIIISKTFFQNYDKYRTIILENMGYEVFNIDEVEYKKNRNELIKRAVEFINT